MKLLNYTSSYIALILLIIISLWAGIFYYAMLDEIYDSIDDGLDNQKLLIIEKAKADSTVLYKNSFDESGYSIIPVASGQLTKKDLYIDTSMYMENEKDYEPVRMLTTTFKSGQQAFQLKIVTSMVEEDDLTAELTYAILWLYLCMIIAILFLNNFILKRIWSPFYKLLKQLRNFRLDQKEPITTPDSNVDEFRILNRTVTDMLQSNVDTFNSQKNFIENAAHELQTPLAIAINKLEAFAENTQLPEEQLRQITSAIENISRLTRLNRSLLLLSRIENHQFQSSVPNNMNAIIHRVLEAFHEQIEYNGIGINIVEDGQCNADMDKELAESLILNLIKNAIVHNVPDGFINIKIKSNSVNFENAGSKALDPKKIFSRFYKENPSVSSSGLGLAITKTIIHLYGFSIKYQFDKKHIIIVTFTK